MNIKKSFISVRNGFVFMKKEVPAVFYCMIVGTILAIIGIFVGNPIPTGIALGLLFYCMMSLNDYRLHLMDEHMKLLGEWCEMNSKNIGQIIDALNGAVEKRTKRSVK